MKKNFTFALELNQTEIWGCQGLLLGVSTLREEIYHKNLAPITRSDKKIFEGSFSVCARPSWDRRHDELWLDNPPRSKSLIEQEGKVSICTTIIVIFRSSTLSIARRTHSHTPEQRIFIHQRIFLFLLFFTTHDKKQKRLRETKSFKAARISQNNNIFGKFTTWFMSRHLSSTLCCLWLKLENLFNLARNSLEKTKIFRASKPILHGMGGSLSLLFFSSLCMEWNYKIKIIDSTREEVEEPWEWGEENSLLKAS